MDKERFSGIYPGMKREEYDGVFALNQTAIKTAYDKSLKHALHDLQQPKEPTEALKEGNALHTLILEPEHFDDRYAPMPVNDKGDRHNRRTNAGNEAWSIFEKEHPGKWPIKPARIAELREIREAVLRHPIARGMIENASHRELSCFWQHPDYDFDCKGQVDLVTEHQGWSWVVDLKSAIDASPRGFSRAVANYGYMIQAAWYLDGLAQIAPADRRFAWLAFEKSAPYDVCIHECDPENLFEGRFRCDTIASRWAKALETDRFEGYPVEIQQTEGMRWAMTHERVADEEGS